MTIDLLAATFWPEAALLGSHPAHPRPAEPDPAATAEDADAAAQREDFWSSVLRHLWAAPEASAIPSWSDADG